MAASGKEHADVVKALIDANADVNARTKVGSACAILRVLRGEGRAAS